MCDIKPVRFIKSGSEIEVREIDESSNEYHWCKCIVKEVNGFSTGESGDIADVALLYDNDDVVNDFCLFDADFNAETPDGWRFTGPFSLLMSFILGHAKEIQTMKEDLQQQESNIRRIVEDVMIDNGLYGSDDETDDETDSIGENESGNTTRIHLDIVPRPHPTNYFSEFFLGVLAIAGGILIGKLINYLH